MTIDNITLGDIAVTCNINCNKQSRLKMMLDISSNMSIQKEKITTYGWSDETTAGNFKMALRGKAIDWLNHTRDTLDFDISTWTNIESEFILNFNVKTNTAQHFKIFIFKERRH